MIKIAPSIIAADFGHLTDSIRKVELAGADMLHIDVMDGHFVPNITIGPFVVKTIRKITVLPLDVHLMITHPLNYISQFAAAGASLISIHTEAVTPLSDAIHAIKATGAKVGIAVNPATPISDNIIHHLKDIDMVLIMTVNPGFSGQSFMPGVLPKIRYLRSLTAERRLSFDIEVDGGITPATAKEAVGAGATVLVSASALFDAPDIFSAMSALRNAGDS